MNENMFSGKENCAKAGMNTLWGMLERGGEGNQILSKIGQITEGFKFLESLDLTP